MALVQALHGPLLGSSARALQLNRTTPKRIGCGRSRCALRVSCVNWDPENLFGAPERGHIARNMIRKKLSQQAEEDEVVRQEKLKQLELRRAAREARVVPETNAGLVDFFMETEAQEIEYEIARCRPRLTDEFFSYLNTEVASLRFKVDRTPEIEDKLAELEALQKVLKEGIEAYDNLATDLIKAKERVAKIFASKDKKSTLLEMVAANELDKSVLILLDQNIATATTAGEKQAVQFMQKVRGAVIKYITL